MNKRTSKQPSVVKQVAEKTGAASQVRAQFAHYEEGIPMSNAAKDVLAERQRQISVEGWTPEHDDEHSSASMAVAAAAYALADAAPYTGLGMDASRLWGLTGWEWSWFKRKGHRSNLVRAGALILAEIERLDRKEARK